MSETQIEAVSYATHLPIIATASGSLNPVHRKRQYKGGVRVLRAQFQRTSEVEKVGVLVELVEGGCCLVLYVVCGEDSNTVLRHAPRQGGATLMVLQCRDTRRELSMFDEMWMGFMERLTEMDVCRRDHCSLPQFCLYRSAAKGRQWTKGCTPWQRKKVPHHRGAMRLKFGIGPRLMFAS